MRPSRGSVEPNPAAGLHRCPVCGGGVGVMPWESVRNLVYAETSSERVSRLSPHYYGGTPKTKRSREIDRCPGTYEMPAS